MIQRSHSRLKSTIKNPLLLKILKLLTVLILVLAHRDYYTPELFGPIAINIAIGMLIGSLLSENRRD